MYTNVHKINQNFYDNSILSLSYFTKHIEKNSIIQNYYLVSQFNAKSGSFYLALSKLKFFCSLGIVCDGR